MREHSDKLNNQAISLATEGHYDEAIACLKRAVVLDRNNSLIWYNLGVTYRDQGKFDEARISLEKAFELNPQSEDICENLAFVCFRMDDKVSALKTVQEGIDYHPMSHRLWNLEGVIFFNDEKYDEAAEAFELAVSIFPFYEDALFNLCDTYEELGNIDGAAVCKMRLKEMEKSKR